MSPSVHSVHRGLSFVVGLLAAIFSAAVDAGEVRVTGVHLCCGGCVLGVTDALDPVDGVSDASADRNAKVVTFTATDEKAAAAGIAAIAKAGFHGDATHGGEEIAFPESGAKAGTVVQELEIRGVHLCCAACVTGTQAAVRVVPGLQKIEIDRKERIVRLFGAGFDEGKAITALNAGGFHGTVHRAEPK